MILASVTPASAVLIACTAVAYALSALASGRAGWFGTRGLLLLAWALHAGALLQGLLASPARFGFAPALSITAWLVLSVYVVETLQYPQLQSRWALAALGACAALLALVFPGAELHLRASPWLPLHWALGIASYGLFAAAVVHAALMMRAEKRIRQAADAPPGLPLLTLERLTFRFVLAGFVLLSATLLAGGVFGDQLQDAQGMSLRWKWDHKSVFSVLSWLTFATLLLGRARFGWRGRKAVRMLYLGAGLLLLAYVGSRFVLEVVLGRVA